MIRCRTCLLPSSLPGSDFDETGACSWCRSNYPNYRPKGADELRRLLEEKRRPQSSVDCLVGVSGGKDSCYVLYELKETFGMRVEAFTYHHDGVHAFALENARKVCESIGVPLHVVSLREHEHLRSFQTFFRAWLDSPNTVTAGMTCVACKHLHLLGSELARDRGIPMMVWANSPLEYSPFLAIKKRSDGIGREGLAKSAALLATKLAASPRFLLGVARHFPTCLNGCLSFAPTSKYLAYRFPMLEQIFFFEYVEWNADQILERLRERTPWTLPASVRSDWHSDCVFNVFKEYMFEKMYGVSYTDGFLSNQIRHGLITRERALELLRESKEFYDSLLMPALETVGLNHLADRIDAGCFRRESVA